MRADFDAGDAVVVLVEVARGAFDVVHKFLGRHPGVDAGGVGLEAEVVRGEEGG